MASMGLDKEDFSAEYPDIFDKLAKACVQLKERNEMNESLVHYLEESMLYILQCKHLTSNEELIREQLINAMRSILDLHHMFSSLKYTLLDITDSEGNVIDKGIGSAILQLILELENEYGGRVPVIILIDEMEKRYDIHEEEVKKVIEELKEQKIVLEPVPGYLKTE